MVVLDIHGDYLGFIQKQKKLYPNNEVKLFYPNLSVSSEDKEIIYTLIEKLGNSLTDPQKDFLSSLLEKVKYEGGRDERSKKMSTKPEVKRIALK